MRKVILFDFDGTVAETVAVGVKTFNALARRYGFGEITPQNVPVLRRKGPRAVMKELEIPLLKVPLVVHGLRQGLRVALPSLRAVRGIRPVLAALRERGYELGLVTMSPDGVVREFLKNNKLEFFDFFQTGIGLFGKAKAIRKLIAREKLAGAAIVFVGDEIRDVEAAKKNELETVGVTWGVNSYEGLADVHPDRIVKKPAELLAILP